MSSAPRITAAKVFDLGQLVLHHRRQRFDGRARDMGGHQHIGDADPTGAVDRFAIEHIERRAAEPAIPERSNHCGFVDNKAARYIDDQAVCAEPVEDVRADKAARLVGARNRDQQGRRPIGKLLKRLYPLPRHRLGIGAPPAYLATEGVEPLRDVASDMAEADDAYALRRYRMAGRQTRFRPAARPDIGVVRHEIAAMRQHHRNGIFGDVARINVSRVAHRYGACPRRIEIDASYPRRDDSDQLEVGQHSEAGSIEPFHTRGDDGCDARAMFGQIAIAIGMVVKADIVELAGWRPQHLQDGAAHDQDARADRRMACRHIFQSLI